MINKLIAVFLALSIALSCLFVPSFALPSDLPDDFSRFITDIWDLTESFDKGEISSSEFIQKFASSMSRFGINYAGDVSCFKDVLKVIEFCGIDVPDEWKEWFYENKMGGGGSGGDRDDSVLNGYGAVAITVNPDYIGSVAESTYKCFIYADYGVVLDEPYFNGATYGWAIAYGGNHGYYDFYHYNGSLTSSNNPYDNSMYVYAPDMSCVLLYGDWRKKDGSKFDNITDLPVKEPPSFDDDTVSDDDIIDFLKDLLEKLQMQFPDLSTIEGLLRAILAKCTDIENRIGEGGNGLTAAELQPLLDQAVLALTLQNNKNNDAVLKSNDELLKELINIRKILQGFDSDEEVPPDEANSILQGLISGLTSGLTQLLGFGFGDSEVSEIIQICINAGTVGTKLMSGIVDVIAFMGVLVPFSVIKTLIETTFNIMFNKNAPADLTFTLDNTSYTFLSSSFLNIPIVAGTLAIVKGLVSIMILYIWLKWARKFFVNLM